MGVRDAVLLDVGDSIGASVISSGHLHRGAQGAAGDVGHVRVTDDPSAACRCGKSGCLDAVASGHALQLRARDAEGTGRGFLSTVAAERAPVLADIVHGVRLADPYCLALVHESARAVGETIARIVNFFNPAMVLLTGSVMEVGDSYLAALRNIVYARSLPLATRDLAITRAGLGDAASMIGAAHLVIDQIFEPDYFARWGGEGVPPPV